MYTKLQKVGISRDERTKREKREPGDRERSLPRMCYSDCFHLFFFLMFIFGERERQRQSMSTGGAWGSRGGAERGRHRIRSRLQAPSCQHRARCGTRTRKPRDHDLSQSQTLNWLNHPGAPDCFNLLKIQYIQVFCNLKMKKKKPAFSSM